MPVKFIEAQETGRKVLRIIIPDPKGNIESKLPVWEDQATAKIE